METILSLLSNEWARILVAALALICFLLILRFAAHLAVNLIKIGCLIFLLLAAFWAVRHFFPW